MATGIHEHRPAHAAKFVNIAYEGSVEKDCGPVGFHVELDFRRDLGILKSRILRKLNREYQGLAGFEGEDVTVIHG